jgi:hypothetical protein
MFITAFPINHYSSVVEIPHFTHKANKRKTKSKTKSPSLDTFPSVPWFFHCLSVYWDTAQTIDIREFNGRTPCIPVSMFLSHDVLQFGISRFPIGCGYIGCHGRPEQVYFSGFQIPQECLALCRGDFPDCSKIPGISA